MSILSNLSKENKGSRLKIEGARGMLDSVTGLLNQIEDARRHAEAVPVAQRASALEFLQAVYRNVGVPLPVRMKAASIAVEYETPRLAATAILDGADMAARLDKAIERSRQVPMKLIEHSSAPTPRSSPGSVGLSGGFGGPR